MSSFLNPFSAVPMDQVRTLVISRPDSIGDVVLTLPMAGLIKEHYPEVRILFLGQPYTRAVIEQCQHVDAWIGADDLSRLPEIPELILHVLPNPAIAAQAHRLGIRWRVGTHRRYYHWLHCNRWVALARKGSPLHEAQLNLRLLEPLNLPFALDREAIPDYYGLQPGPPLPESLQGFLDPQRYNLILHTRSAGSAREWPMERFLELIGALDPGKFQILLTGTAKDKPLLRPLVEAAGSRVQDLSGAMDLPTLIRFIYEADGLVANSTGPLHLAAALGIDTLGLYPPIRPMDPGRWGPLGPRAQYFVQDKSCQDCRRNPAACSCMGEISAPSLSAALDILYHQRIPRTHG